MHVNCALILFSGAIIRARRVPSCGQEMTAEEKEEAEEKRRVEAAEAACEVASRANVGVGKRATSNFIR